MLQSLYQFPFAPPNPFCNCPCCVTYFWYPGYMSYSNYLQHCLHCISLVGAAQPSYSSYDAASHVGTSGDEVVSLEHYEEIPQQQVATLGDEVVSLEHRGVVALEFQNPQQAAPVDSRE